MAGIDSGRAFYAGLLEALTRVMGTARDTRAITGPGSPCSRPGSAPSWA
jgi:hypothetical protein